MHAIERRRKRAMMDKLEDARKTVATDKVVNKIKLAAIKASRSVARPAASLADAEASTSCSRVQAGLIDQVSSRDDASGM